MARRDTNGALMATLRGELPHIAAAWLEPLRVEMERLCMMAVDPKVSDAAFVAAVARAAEELPEWWDRLDAGPLAELLEKGMGAAMVNGAANE